MGAIGLLEYGKYVRPFIGERYSGDLVIYHQIGKHQFFILVDCIGHGEQAYLMGVNIRSSIENCWTLNPSELLDDLGSSLKKGVGAAIGVLVINIEDYSYKYAGLGNISCKIVGKNKLDLRSSDGILGMRNRSTITYKGTINAGDLVILHSDGLSNLSAIDDWNRYKIQSCSFAAKKLIEHLGTDLDDSSCLIIKYKKN